MVGRMGRLLAVGKWPRILKRDLPSVPRVPPALPLYETENFGTSPIFGQLSDKPLLACS
jgi:hypothetical protein